MSAAPDEGDMARDAPGVVQHWIGRVRHPGSAVVDIDQLTRVTVRAAPLGGPAATVEARVVRRLPRSLLIRSWAPLKLSTASRHSLIALLIIEAVAAWIVGAIVFRRWIGIVRVAPMQLAHRHLRHARFLQPEVGPELGDHLLAGELAVNPCGSSAAAEAASPIGAAPRWRRGLRRIPSARPGSRRPWSGN